jgi:IS5 family transposase
LQAKFVLWYTTVQGNFTTFPTDAKLCKKVIDKSNDIAKKRALNSVRSTKKRAYKLLHDTTSHHPKRIRKSKKAKKRLQTIVNTQLREPDKKLIVGQKAIYREKLELYTRAMNQQKTDKNKVYNIYRVHSGGQSVQAI